MQVEPFHGYSDDYSFRGYSFWLRKVPKGPSP